MSRSITYVLVVLVVSAWWTVAGLGGFSGPMSHQLHGSQPLVFSTLNADGTRYEALASFNAGSAQFERMDNLLANSIALRPLYAPYLLDRAEIAIRAGNTSVAENLVERAVTLWSNRPALLWRAAMLNIRLSNRQGALEVFKKYLANDPRDFSRVLAVSRRVEPDASTLLHALLPIDNDGRDKRVESLIAIMQNARSSHDSELGTAVWHMLPESIRRKPEILGPYVEWMIAEDLTREALAAWKQFSAEPLMARFSNPGFEQPLTGGLDWRRIDMHQVVMKRDERVANSGNYSLSVAFTGEDNISFNNIRKFVPVKPGARYRLTFFWRGDALTTRSGPYLNIAAPDGRRIVRSESRWGTWNWVRESVDFTVPDQIDVVEVSVARQRTDALDNKIRGQLWLDDFELRQISAGDGDGTRI